MICSGRRSRRSPGRTPCAFATSSSATRPTSPCRRRLEPTSTSATPAGSRASARPSPSRTPASASTSSARTPWPVRSGRTATRHMTSPFGRGSGWPKQPARPTAAATSRARSASSIAPSSSSVPRSPRRPSSCRRSDPPSRRPERFDQAAEVAERAVELGERLGLPLVRWRAVVEGERLRLYRHPESVDVGATIAVAEAAVAALRELGDDLGLSRASYLMCDLAWTTGHIEASFEHAERAVEYARRAGIGFEVAAALNFIAALVEGRTPVSEAISRCVALEREVEGHRAAELSLLGCRAVLAAMAGRARRRARRHGAVAGRSRGARSPRGLGLDGPHGRAGRDAGREPGGRGESRPRRPTGHARDRRPLVSLSELSSTTRTRFSPRNATTTRQRPSRKSTLSPRRATWSG